MPPLKEVKEGFRQDTGWRVYTLDHIRMPIVSRSMPPLKEEKQGFRHEGGLDSVHHGQHQETRCLAFYAAPEGGKTGI
jgi:hypothetical protein